MDVWNDYIKASIDMYTNTPVPSFMYSVCSLAVSIQVHIYCHYKNKQLIEWNKDIENEVKQSVDMAQHILSVFCQHRQWLLSVILRCTNVSYKKAWAHIFKLCASQIKQLCGDNYGQLITGKNH